jgi:hypothetical protein
MRRAFCLILLASGAVPAGFAQTPTKRAALAPLGGLVGVWNGTGMPSGTREEQQKGFWTETITCEWQFKGDDAWLKLDFAKGKHFLAGQIRSLGDAQEFQLILTTKDKATQAFTGLLKGKVLALTRDDPDTKEVQKIVVTMLHENRILYRYDVKPPDKGLFYHKYTVGATKEGVPFAVGDGKPECIVSGGLGVMPVSYMGKTYYVCCGGCRSEFNDNPKKYVEEYEAKLKKKGK